MGISNINVTINKNCHIGKNVTIEEDVYIDYNCIIRDNVIIRSGTYIGANCILGEYQADKIKDFSLDNDMLIIGKNSIIRSDTIIYSGTTIGDNFQTGHRVTVREKAMIGNNVSIGTFSDIQGYCKIGDYVKMHSNVHIGQKSVIDDFVWIFPYAVLTNDPTPPSENLIGVTLKSFAVIATGSILLPGVTVESDTLVAAGAIVTKDVHEGDIVGGNPARKISEISKIKNHITGEKVYPWRYTFKRGMPWQESNYQEWYQSVMKNCND